MNIFDKFITPNTLTTINVSHAVRVPIEARLMDRDNFVPEITEFEVPKKAIMALLRGDTFQRFRFTPEFEQIRTRKVRERVLRNEISTIHKTTSRND